MKSWFAALMMILTFGNMANAQNGVHYQHLKFLEPVVGNWKVELKEGDKVVSRGQEASEWMLSKNCLKQYGWGTLDGQNLCYRFYTVWNAKSREVLQLAVGAMDGSYAMTQRIGTYEPGSPKWSTRDTTNVSDGTRYTGLVTVNLADQTGYTMDFTENTKNGEPTPSQHSSYVPDQPVKEPPFDATPGPGHEKLKFLDNAVGRWKLEGDIPGQGKYVGEEVNQWIYDKNFMLTKGRGTLPGEQRVDYELLIGYDPAEETIVTWIFGSDGGLGLRQGSYDAATQTLKSKQLGIDADGNESRAIVDVQQIDNDHFVLKFDNQLSLDAPVVEVTGTRITQ